MHSFEGHSNESACRKKVRLGLEQVINSAPICVLDEYEIQKKHNFKKAFNNWCWGFQVLEHVYSNTPYDYNDTFIRYTCQHKCGMDTICI